VPATALAGLLAAANALSSAQLAAAHPVSGGTYEYGYRLLRPSVGFAAGWTFLCAKAASAATAALGLSGYGLSALGLESGAVARSALAVAVVGVLTALVLIGLRRSAITNAIIVSISLAALIAFVVTVGVTNAHDDAPLAQRIGLHEAPGLGLLNATALMFVAFTGYGRIATLGEEVREPRRTIPRAIIATLVLSVVLYVLVATAGVLAIGPEELSRSVVATGAPLEDSARAVDAGWLAVVVSLAAVTAMLGVLLNLLLALSRVLLAMARRGDAPPMFAHVHESGRAPTPACLAVGAAVAGVAAIGSIELAWSFSAFTVLIYYAITNLAALRLRPAQRLFHRWIAWAGLLGCVGLAWWVDARVWLFGVTLIAAGFVLRSLGRRLWSDRLDRV
jgi:APA family basic amino acid/polyamine antiporter